MITHDTHSASETPEAGTLLQRSRSAEAAPLARAKAAAVSAGSEYTYISLHLRSPELSEESRMRLESLGVDCLMEAGAHRAYGIVLNSRRAFSTISRDPAVSKIVEEEPPPGK